MATDGEAETSMTLLGRLHDNPSDPHAWRLFVELYRPRIRVVPHLGLASLGRRNVVQDVLVKLFAAMSKFQYDPAQLSSMAEDGDETRLVRFPRRPAQGPRPWSEPDRFDRGFGRRSIRPGAPYRGRVRLRADRRSDAPRAAARQAGDLAGIPSHGGRGALRAQPPPRSFRCRLRTFSWPRIVCRRCFRRKFEILRDSE